MFLSNVLNILPYPQEKINPGTHSNPSLRDCTNAKVYHGRLPQIWDKDSSFPMVHSEYLSFRQLLSHLLPLVYSPLNPTLGLIICLTISKISLILLSCTGFQPPYQGFSTDLKFPISISTCRLPLHYWTLNQRPLLPYHSRKLWYFSVQLPLSRTEYEGFSSFRLHFFSPLS